MWNVWPWEMDRGLWDLNLLAFKLQVISRYYFSFADWQNSRRSMKLNKLGYLQLKIRDDSLVHQTKITDLLNIDTQSDVGSIFTTRPKGL